MPLPPVTIFFMMRLTVESAAGLYFAATSLYAGPIEAPLDSLLRRWQVVQSLAPISSSPLSAAVVVDAGAVEGVVAADAAVSLLSADFVSPPLPQAAIS